MVTENLVKKQKGECSLATWIKRRVKRNQNVISITCGPTGSGKSYVDLGLCLEIDPEFNVSKQIVFNFTEFMKLLNDEEFKKKKYKQIIYEEFQISASNRNWQSLMNKSINYILSTFRHQNIILYINAPYQDFLDSQTMKLVHLVIETKAINRQKKTVRVRPKILDYNAKLKKYYEHSIYSIYPNGKIMWVPILNVRKAPDEVCKAYEEKKSEFTTNLNREIMLEAEAFEKKGKKKEEEKDEPINLLNETQLKIYNHIKENPGKFQKDYAPEIGISGPKLSKEIKQIEKKGIFVKKYIKEKEFSENFNKFRANKSKEPLNLTSKGSK